VPIYSFEKHAREAKTQPIYSPHVLVLEGIFALHDQRVLDLLDLKVFAEADPDLCLSRRLMRDVRDRGRDIEGCIKQWFSFVKPNFHKFVEPQRNQADIIVPRGVENQVAISMISDRVRKTLLQKSSEHRAQLAQLGEAVDETPLSANAIVLDQKPQIVAIHTLLLDPLLQREDFVFYFDRIASLLIEEAGSYVHFQQQIVTTPQYTRYNGLVPLAETSAVSILRGGSVLETGLKRVIPDCQIGRLLIQSNYRTGEPELHYLKLSPGISSHGAVLVLDTQMSSGGAALMAVRVLIDHGVAEDKIVFVAYTAGRRGVGRLLSVFPDVKVVVCRLVDDYEERWVESRYLGC
jgi:uridine kinase